MEVANPKWLSQKTIMDIYFSHPYSFGERGISENKNRLIRRFFLKELTLIQ